MGCTPIGCAIGFGNLSVKSSFDLRQKTLSPVTSCVGNATSENFWGHILQLWLQKNVDVF
jgi:hypothetical protein